MLDFQKIALSGLNAIGLVGAISATMFIAGCSFSYGFAVAARMTGRL